MKTLAIIGGGVCGHSLLFTLSKLPKRYHKIYFFDQRDFFNACALNSTAIVAPRGVSEGHSDLGNFLVEGYKTFKEHNDQDGPQGIERITQYTGASSKIDQMKTRYPGGEMKGDLYIATEEAFSIHPSTYLKWLFEASRKNLDFEFHQDAVVEVTPGNKVKIRTQNNLELEADEVIFSAGSSQALWKKLFPDSKLSKTKTVQGSYFEYSNVDMGETSFSKTLEGDNAIYSSLHKTLLIGSTTQESSLELAPEKELHEIKERLKKFVEIPDSKPMIRVGLREKAPKREPYLIVQDNLKAVGGFYKNGYSLSMLFCQKLFSSTPL